MQEIKLCIILFLHIFFIYEGFSAKQQALELIPERAEITYSNDKYVVNNTVNVRRYSRRSGYVVNFWGYCKHQWGNNVTIDIVIYEFLHNEYKRSFIEFHSKLCDLINKDEYIGGAIRKYGLICPLPKGYNGITNVTMTIPSFPYVFPFTKFKAHVVFRTDTDMIGEGDLYVTAKQVPLH